LPAPSITGSDPRRRAIFTIVSCNYIAYAATLMQSVRDLHPEVDRFIVLADSYRNFSGLDAAAELIFCDDLGIELIANMKLWYTVIEFNTAIKPFVFRHLFDQCGFDEVVYLDPDILLFQPLADVWGGLSQHNIVLIPHMMQPLQDGKEPSDLTIMKSGVYNLGFLGVRNDPAARGLIDWWAGRCYLHCRVDIGGNMFTDQRWMDLAPVFVPNPLILRHPGYDVAYWNLCHRSVRRGGDGTWLVDEGPLAFFHFSGINPEDPTVFSKHQNRFTVDTLGEVAQLCHLYRERVLANGWLKCAGIRYGFAAFPDGRPIEDAMRHWFRRAVDSGRIEAAAALTVDSRFFDQPDEELAEKGIALTRFMYQFWLNRPDLREAFDIFTPRGYNGYLDWFLGGEARRQGVDGRSIAAARRLRNEAEPDTRVASPPEVAPPWPSVSRQSWRGPAREAARFLEGDVVASIACRQILLPTQIALAWEMRSDLRAHFRLRTVDELFSFLGWCLTNGVAEGVVCCDELSPDFLTEMARESSTSSYYQDVPITTGLVAMRSAGCDNRMYEPRRRFPVERAGRLAHGLWFAYVAARRYKWPRVLVAPLLSYFEAPSDVALEGFALPRVVTAIWELREDIQSVYQLDSAASVTGFVLWLLAFGLQEFEISVDQLGPGLRDFLLNESPRCPGLERIIEMLYATRGDLQEWSDIETVAGRQELRSWWWQVAVRAESVAITLLGLGDKPTEEQDRPVYTAKVALTGQWSAPTGRGEDVRCSAACLLEVGFSDFLIVDSEKHQVLRADGKALPRDCKVQVDVNVLHLNADTAYSDWRLMQRLNVSARKSVGFWAWELERLPSYWRYAFSFFDEIWASTRFAEGAFRHEQLRPVRLVPMAVVAPAMGREISRRELRLLDDATVFLFVFDFRSFAARKNPEAVVQAFLQAFPSGDENVFLVIKSMGAEENCPRLEWLTSLCTDPRISLRDIKLDRDELLGLIKASDAFVSLHRSEGFGRGPAEAMLLGRPTILTAYSGTKDFVSDGSAFLVDYELVRVQPGEYIGVEDQSWADANVETAARHMRTIHENPAEAHRVGALGRRQVTRLLSPSVIGPKLHDALMRLLSEPEIQQSLRARKRPDTVGKIQVPSRMRLVSTPKSRRRGARTEWGVA
jgi:glycosyltransferase involved in cell wall biosynthesis